MAEKSLKKNAALNVIKTLMGILFPLITFPYASRILLPDGIGKVNFANSVVAYFAIFSSLGISSYGIREAAKVRCDRGLLSKLVQELFLINLFSTIVAYCFFFIALFFLPFLSSYRILLLVSGASMLLTTIGMDWLYSALEEFRYITIRTIIFQLISLCLLFIFVKTEDDYVKYAAISIISTGGANVLNLIHSRKFVSFNFKIKMEFAKHIKPILILFATSLAASIFTTLDTSMLGVMTNAVEVGYYTAGVKIVRMIRDLFPAVFGVLFARVSFYISSNENDKLEQLAEKTFSFIFCFALPAVYGMIILMKPLIILLAGENFFKAITVGRILSPLVFISACSGFLGGQILISHRKDKTYLLSMVVAAMTNIVLNYIFIPQWGAIGAALGTVFAELAILVVDVISLRMFLRKLQWFRIGLQFLFATFVMGICVYFIQKLFVYNIILQLSVSVFVGIFVYFFMLIVLKNTFIHCILNDIMSRVFKRIRNR